MNETARALRDAHARDADANRREARRFATWAMNTVDRDPGAATARAGIAAACAGIAVAHELRAQRIEQTEEDRP